MLVAALACVCFVVQQFLFPLHLALHDHVSSGELGEHARSHAESSHGDDARHGHELARTDDANEDASEDHQPHPIEDHQELLAEPAVLPTLVQTAIAPASLGPGLHVFDPPAQAQSQFEELGVRAPPPRTAAPRAPPIVV